LRVGAADRRARTRGLLPDLSAPAAREAALAEFRADIYTDASRESLEFKWRTITRMMADWGVELYPQRTEGVLAGGLAKGRGLS
jgi:hypothetical protein